MIYGIKFKAAESCTLPVEAFHRGGLPMPPPDLENLDVAISHTSDFPVWISFIQGAAAGPNVARAIQVPVGQEILVSRDTCVLLSSADPLIRGGEQARLAVDQPAMSIYTPLNCLVTVTRGTATVRKASA